VTAGETALFEIRKGPQVARLTETVLAGDRKTVDIGLGSRIAVGDIASINLRETSPSYDDYSIVYGSIRPTVFRETYVEIRLMSGAVLTYTTHLSQSDDRLLSSLIKATNKSKVPGCPR
jgi:hypothetical protein